MESSHTNWSRTCLEQVVLLAGRKVAAIALARQLDDAGAWRSLVLLLNKKGEGIANSDWLPIQRRGNRSRARETHWIVAAGKRLF